MKKLKKLIVISVLFCQLPAVAQQNSPSVNATPEQFQAFLNFPDNQPLMMLNFVKFRDKSDTGESGREMYERYLKESKPFADKVGAEVIWYGKPLYILIGPSSETLWDAMFVIRFSDKTKFFAMNQAEGFPSALRSNALADSRLVACSVEGNLFEED